VPILIVVNVPHQHVGHPSANGVRPVVAFGRFRAGVRPLRMSDALRTRSVLDQQFVVSKKLRQDFFRQCLASRIDGFGWRT